MLPFFRFLDLYFNWSNQFATNGVIHGIDDVLFVPPEALDVIEFLPAQFSTLLLGLVKTGLYHDFRVTATAGQTFFAPTNFAFEKLPLPVTAFLFSEHGLKYLKAILKYHVVSNQTLYSDAYYNAKEGHVKERNIPGGLYHVSASLLQLDHFSKGFRTYACVRAGRSIFPPY